MYFSVVPTSIADIIVPSPTLPSVCVIIIHVIRDTITIAESKYTFIFENGFFVTIAIACIAPSPASGIIFGGK